MRTLTLLTREQYYDWLKKIPSSACPFCEWKDNQIVLYEGDAWLWIVCRAPYWQYHTMLIPKRHMSDIDEMTAQEQGEFFRMYKFAVQSYQSAELEWADGAKVNKYMFFWRLRYDLFDPHTKTQKLPHLHVHIVPDRDHRFDPIVDFEAHSLSIEKLVLEVGMKVHDKIRS